MIISTIHCQKERKKAKYKQQIIYQDQIYSVLTYRAVVSVYPAV